MVVYCTIALAHSLQNSFFLLNLHSRVPAEPFGSVASLRVVAGGPTSNTPVGWQGCEQPRAASCILTALASAPACSPRAVVVVSQRFAAPGRQKQGAVPKGSVEGNREEAGWHCEAHLRCVGCGTWVGKRLVFAGRKRLGRACERGI